jgi:cytochrome c oxidase assembly protein subunit 11
MSAHASTATASAAAANNRLLKKLGVVAVAMFGFGFALVPFYEKMCEVTGIRNVLLADEAPVKNTQADLTRKITIEFDSNVQRLAWTFKPVDRHIEINPGVVTQVMYEVKNTLDRPVTGQAVPGYAPAVAAQYFKKLDCFCFKQQTLAAGETRLMPVVFVIDPDMPKDVNTLTLSYTFFEVNGTAKGSKG